MTTIERLGIQGIRSYGPDQEQVCVLRWLRECARRRESDRLCAR